MTESIDWLEDKLELANTKLKFMETTAFCVLCAALLLLGFFVYGLADYLVRFPSVVRILITLGLAVGTAFLARRFAPRFLQRLADLEKVARAVETVKEKAGESQRSLIVCALQFARNPGIPGSVELKNETIRLARTRCVDPAGVPIYDRRLMRYARRSFSFAALAALACYLFFMPYLRVFLLRSLAINARYPTATRIEHITWNANAAMRMDYPIEVKAEGRLPSSGKIIVSYQGERKFSIPLSRDEDKPGTYSALLVSPLKSFRFTVRLGDYVSDALTVTVCPPPFVETGHIEVTPPAYTGLPSRRQEIKNVQVPEGSLLSVIVKPNGPITKGELLVGKHTVVPMQNSLNGVAASVRVTNSTPFSIRLTDTRGLMNAERPVYSIVSVPDEPPRIELISPKPGTFRSKLSRLVFHVQARDDYGIGSTRIAYRIYRPDSENIEEKEKLVKNGEFPLKTAGSAREPSGRLSKLVRDFPAEEGDRIAFSAMVKDNRPEPSQESHSTEVSVFVVSPEELRAILGREQERVTTLVGKLRDDERRQAEAIGNRLKGK